MPGHRQCSSLGQQLLEPRDVEFAGQPGELGVGVYPDAHVRRAALVAAARSRDRAERDPSGRGVGVGRDHVHLRCGERLEFAGVSCRGDVDAGPVGVHRDVRNLGRRHVCRIEHAVRRGLTGRRGDVEAGIGRERKLDGGAGERPAQRLGIGPAHHAVQQRGRFLLHRRVRMVGARQRPGRVDGDELAAHEFGLRVDVEPGEHEGDLVAEPAQRVQSDLERGRRWFTAYPADAHPIGAVLCERDRVETSGDVGAGIARAADLVQQLRGDRADRHLAARAGMLGDHRRPVRRHLGDREAERLAERGQLAEEGVVASGRLRAALDDVPGHDRSGELVVGRRAPSRSARRPDRLPAMRR